VTVVPEVPLGTAKVQLNAPVAPVVNEPDVHTVIVTPSNTIDANPVDIATAFLRAFDAQEHLDQVGNWQYLTGTLPALESAWNGFGVQVAVEPGGAMVAHSELVYVVDARGRTRYILDADPGPATAATQSSFAVTLAQALQTTLHDS